MEHWLPLFHAGMETIFDYVPGSPVVLEPLDEDAARERLEQIKDYSRGARAGAWRRATAARRIGRCRRIGSISPTPNGGSG